MSDVAAVSSQATVKVGTGAAKASGAAAAAGPVLDGAFAALLGKASADKGTAGQNGEPVSEGNFAALVAAGGEVKPARLDLDPAALPGEVKGKPIPADPALPALGTETGDMPDGLPGKSTDETDPMTGKPRKPAATGKPAATEETIDPATHAPAIAAQAAPVSAQPVAAAPEAPRPGKARAAQGEPVAEIARAGHATEAPGSRAAQLAATASAATKAAPGDAKAVPVPAAEAFAAAKAQPQSAAAPGNADAPAAATGQQPTSQQAGQQAGQGSEGGEPGTEGRRNKSGAPVARAAAAVTPTSEAPAARAADPLREIVQSLPPVLQAQLNVAAPTGAAGPVASTGELLAGQAIDMSVSGQWIDRMANEIAALAEGTGHSRFQLSPPNLGRIQVDLWQAGDKMNLQLMTETDEAARRLREGQGSLETHARVAQLALGTVSVARSETPLEDRRDPAQGQPRQQNAEAGQDGQQQASAQAQGQSGQGRRNNAVNHDGLAAVIGAEPQAEPDRATSRGNDPRVRFA